MWFNKETNAITVVYSKTTSILSWDTEETSVDLLISQLSRGYTVFVWTNPTANNAWENANLIQSPIPLSIGYNDDSCNEQLQPRKTMDNSYLLQSADQRILKTWIALKRCFNMKQNKTSAMAIKWSVWKIYAWNNQTRKPLATTATLVLNKKRASSSWPPGR